MIPDSRLWYTFRLLYAVRTRRDGLVLIDDDRWLIRAADTEAAYQEAKAGGRAVAASVHGGDPGQQYRFLGLGGLTLVGPRLADGIELEKYIVPRFRSRRCSPRSRLMAFNPAGPAFKGPDRQCRNEQLFTHHKWYLAEEIFTVSGAGTKTSDTSASFRLSRFVLIKTDDPALAYDRSVADGSLPDVVQNGTYCGLRQWLVRKNRGWTPAQATCQVSDRARVRGSGRCESRRIFS